MAISSVGNNTFYNQAGTSSQSATITNQPSSATAGNVPGEASSVVTLSAGANWIAGANAVGLTVAISSIPAQLIDNNGQTSSDALARIKAAAAQSVQDIHRPYDAATHKSIGVISQTNFENEVQNLGGSLSSADALFVALDANSNGFVSDSELYTALGSTQSNPNSTTSQALMRLMDANDDGSVSTMEYEKVELGLTNVETPGDS
ncbi:MAG TPA: hypothetical protein VL550_07840 [Rhodocyclaceae bacterium]|nr:hypothetical protein [Rhodocyclaceae bacterium]